MNFLTLLAAFAVATCATVAQAQPQPGQTVNAFDGDGNAVSGTLLQYRPHVRNGQNPSQARVVLQRYNYATRKVETTSAWFPEGGFVVGQKTTVNGAPVTQTVVQQPQWPTYVGHLHVTSQVVNSGNSRNSNRVTGATASASSSSYSSSRSSSHVVNRNAPAPYKYGYYYYNGYRYPITRYYLRNGVRIGYYGYGGRIYYW